MKTFIAAVLLCLLVACDRQTKRSSDQVSDLNRKVEAVTENEKQFFADSTGAPAPPPGDPAPKKINPNAQPLPNPDWDRKIVKDATLNLEVKDYNAFSAGFREKIRSLGGYVAQEDQNQTDYKIENTLVIKVPVDQFDNALAQLSTGVEKVNERKVTSQDVTAEYVDTRARIEARKQVRQRYTDLMNQAKNMEEILSVQNEINSIQEEIEAATGRVNYLGHAAVFSTINLTYYQVLDATAGDKEGAKPGTRTRISEAFKTGWSWITDLFIGLVSIWPLFLAGFVAVIVYKRAKPAKPRQTA